MKKFITNILLFSGILLIMLITLDRVVTYGLRKSHAPVFVNLTKIYNNEIKADIIINGSSKALVQLSPSIIDSTLNTNSYNLGMNGTMFQLQKLVYKLYRKENNPSKYIIQVVSNGTLKQENNMHMYKRYAPYLNEDLVKKEAKKLNGFTTADYYLPMSRYSGFAIEIINGIFNMIDITLPTEQSKKVKGYAPNSSSWDNSFEEYKKANKKGLTINIPNENVIAFDQFIKSCKKDGTELIMIYPPTYYESHSFINNRDSIINIYQTVASQNNIPFFNYSNDSTFHTKEYFYNSQHLNKKGSELFTKIMCNDLNKIIK